MKIKTTYQAYRLRARRFGVQQVAGEMRRKGFPLYCAMYALVISR